MKKRISLISRVFKYIEPLWIGEDNKISLKAILAIVFSIDFIRSLAFAIRHWASDKNLGDLAMILGLEAGLIAALLGITAWSNITAKRIDAETYIAPETTDSK